MTDFWRKSNTKLTYSKISVILMLFYCYMYTMADILYPSKQIIIVSFLLAVVCVLVPHITDRTHGVIFDNFTILWLLCFIIALFHNERLIKGDYAPKMICWFSIVVILILLRGINSWMKFFIKLVCIFTIIHIIFAWVFKIATPFFNLFSSLYSGITLSTMLTHYTNGYLLGITTHYSTLAIYLGNGSIAFWSLFQCSNSKIYKRRYLILFVVTAVTLTMVGKRGMIIFVVITIGIYAIIIKARNLKKVLPVVIKYVAIAFVIIILMIIAANTIMPQLLMTIRRFLEGTEGTDITSGRSKMWMLALTEFLKNPFWGIGWFGYREVYETAWYHGSLFEQLDTHNVYLQLLCETGIIGFILFMTAILGTFAVSIKDLRKTIFNDNNDKYKICKPYLAFSVALQLLFVLYCFTGNPLYDPQNFIIYFLSIAIAYNVHRFMRSS